MTDWIVDELRGIAEFLEASLLLDATIDEQSERARIVLDHSRSHALPCQPMQDLKESVTRSDRLAEKVKELLRSASADLLWMPAKDTMVPEDERMKTGVRIGGEFTRRTTLRYINDLIDLVYQGQRVAGAIHIAADALWDRFPQNEWPRDPGRDEAANKNSSVVPECSRLSAVNEEIIWEVSTLCSQVEMCVTRLRRLVLQIESLVEQLNPAGMSVLCP